jgi:hypothetical protein
MPEESPQPLPPAEQSLAANAESTDVLESKLVESTPDLMTESLFVCECAEWMRTACDGEPIYKEHKGKRYCVLHYPNKDKAADFESTFLKKLEARDFNFRGVWFPEEVDFLGFKFSTEAHFTGAIFRARANFISTTFSAKADFNGATFKSMAFFDSATFRTTAAFFHAKFRSSAHFNSTTFIAGAFFGLTTFSTEAQFIFAKFGDKVDFNGATFSAKVNFISAIFSAKADFSSTTFIDQVNFSGNPSFSSQSAFVMQFSSIEKPERISFHTVTLRPHWFVNVDPREFVFTDVSWNWQAISIKGEIQSLVESGVDSPHRLLAIACRQLAENAEANNRYEEASHFRYWAMDLARHHKWAGLVFWKTDWLHVLYWAVSGYGERMLRAFAWLLAVWTIFALLYTQVGFTKPEDKSVTPTANPVIAVEPDAIGQPLPFKRAFTYSLGVMSLQKPDPKPLTGTAQTLVLLETILGPLQAALLALAIRRKFMR